MARSFKSFHNESISSLKQSLNIIHIDCETLTLAELKSAAMQAQQAASTLWRMVGIKENEEDIVFSQKEKTVNKGN